VIKDETADSAPFSVPSPTWSFCFTSIFDHLDKETGEVLDG
jgi:hypothetical protein